KPLAGKVEAMLKTKSVKIKAKAQHLAQNAEKQNVIKELDDVVVARHAHSPVAQSIRPTCCQQHGQKPETHRQIANLQPTLAAVVLARLWRIRLKNCGVGRAHFFAPWNSRVTNAAGADELLTMVCPGACTQLSPPGASVRLVCGSALPPPRFKADTATIR